MRILNNNKIQNGFTLIEMMIVVAVMGIGILILSQMLSSNIKLLGGTSKLTAASRVLEMEMERYYALPFDEIIDGDEIPFRSPLKAVANAAANANIKSISSNLKEIVLTITFMDGKVEKSRTLKMLKAK